MRILHVYDVIQLIVVTSVLTDRPKKLFILVNPFGGKKCALELFHKQVKPLLAAADIQYTLQGMSLFAPILMVFLISFLFLLLIFLVCLSPML